MKKIRVLIVAGTMDLGGIENQLMHLLRRADKNQFQIDFTTTMDTPYFLEEIVSLGGRCIRIPEMQWRNPLPYCRALYRTMKEGQYDIVHSHELFHSGIVLLIARLAGVKGRFCHAHNWRDSIKQKASPIRCIYSRMMGWMIRLFSTHRLACSTPAGRFLYGKASFDLVFNSVDTDRFLHARFGTAPGTCEDGWTVILHAGRMTEVKNQLFLTEIAAEFRRRGKKIRILCAGTGNASYEAGVRQAIQQKQLQDYIRILGPRSDMPELMARSDAFVLPSRYEGMPLVLIEAQAAGLSCVCADTFSHEVDFGLGQIRWLPLTDGPTFWADALEQAASSGKTPMESILAAIQEKGFDASSFTDTLCSMYEAAVGGTG